MALTAGLSDLEAAREVRLFGLMRTATGGTKEEAEAWLERRLNKPARQQASHPADLAAAQRASLEALGYKVVE
jgi:hypothetical protein